LAEEDDSGPSKAPLVIAMGKLERLLDDLNVRTDRLLKIQEAQIPTGESLSFNVAVTSTAAQINSVYLLPDGQRWYGPWISVDIINLGPAGVYYLVNNQLGRFAYASIPANAVKVVNLRTRRLSSMTLYTATGQTTTVTLIFQR
jgi:hypothetical protein